MYTVHCTFVIIMYGYITPYKPDLTLPSWTVYKAFYCGLCKATGKLFGQTPRLATNFDITFVAALLHDYVTQDVEFDKAGCIANPIKKRVYIKRNPLLDRIAAANIILAYYKLADDVEDGGGLKKKLAKKFFNKSRRKAAEFLPEADTLIAAMYTDLRQLEKADCNSLDRASHPFAELTADLAELLISTHSAQCTAFNEGQEESLTNPDNNCALSEEYSAFPEFRSLCYNIGKFIYLIDALDDVGEDFKKKRYNPFLAAYGGYRKRRQFFDDNKDKIDFITATVLNRAAECFNQLQLTQSNTLLKNIVHKGLRSKLEQVLASDRKVGNKKFGRVKIKPEETDAQQRPL